jgi:DNA-binding MarR family transcriptional regulator
VQAGGEHVDDELDPFDAVAQLSFAVQTLLGDIAAAHELSITQLRLLGILRDREPAMLDLARHLNLEKSSVTGLIDRAQRRGLVERTTAPHDGRAIHVRLTAEGRRLTDARRDGRSTPRREPRRRSRHAAPSLDGREHNHVLEPGGEQPARPDRHLVLVLGDLLEQAHGSDRRR